MIINATSLLPLLKEKIRPTHSDASRHVLCPHCEIRTKLNTLSDGRRKCTVCGRKFRINKVTAGNKLQQCAEILLCFCFDFSAHRTARITHHRHPLVGVYYEHFRRLLAESTLPKDKIPLLTASDKAIHKAHDKTRCRWCNTKLHSGGSGSKPPVFGIQFKDNGEVYIDPLKDDEAVFHFHTFGERDEAPGRREGYAGFICCGKFHRFTKGEGVKHDGAEQLWTWIRERVRSHHGIWKRNTGFYLKELEWKYNNRSYDPDVQAKKIIGLMPKDFLTSWSFRAEPKRPSRKA